MAKNITIVSDHSGKVISEPVIISIEKQGYTVIDKNGNAYNRIIVEIDESEMTAFIKTVKFVKPNAQDIPKFVGDFTGQVTMEQKPNARL